jgi:DNA-binding transcriptional LysR family regulator
MDKLRALQYFIAAAEEGSLSAAARKLEVSLPAVAKLITSLERKLGTALFDRSARGLTLTAGGERYLEACQPLLEQLSNADDVVSDLVAHPRGTIVVGATHHVAQYCILPALPQFHARYPDLQIDLRTVLRPSDPDAAGADVFIVLGWPDIGDLVHRRIAQTRYLVCASPGYWAAHGIPQRPRDLERHACLLLRVPNGTVLDLWEFERAGVAETVTVGSWLATTHRDIITDAAIAGEGVGRFSDLTIRDHLQSGRLVQALVDWESKNSPPVNLLYRPRHRRTPAVRVFIDFVTNLFRDLEASEGTARLAPERPYWYRGQYRRASTWVPKRG